MTKYYLSDGEKKWGPFEKSQILERLDKGEISLFDLICEEGGVEFIPLMNHEDFTKDSKEPAEEQEHIHGLLSTGIDRSENTQTALKGLLESEIAPKEVLSAKPTAPPKTDDIPQEEWFTISHGKLNGPFSFLQIVGLLATQRLKEFDLIQLGELGKPKKVAETPNFHPDRLKELKETNLGPAIEGKSFRRAHQRYNVGQKILTYSSEKFYKVICVEMSWGGVGILTSKPLFELGSEILLKFELADKIEKFDAKGKVVSLRKVRIANKENKFFRYGVQFSARSDEAEVFLKKFIG